MKNTTQFPDIEGHIFTSVIRTKNGDNKDAIRFIRDDGRIFEFAHLQECCESVYIESINGDLNNLVGNHILHATSTITTDRSDWGDSDTKTFYWFKTAKGEVTIRWYGYSNGYYSENVDFYEVTSH